MKNVFKTIGRLLSKLDGVWAVPLFFLLFAGVSPLLFSMFGFAAGSYDVAFIQPLFLAIAVVIGAINAALYGLWFNFRGLYKWLYGKKNEEGKVVNESKIEFQKLEAWQKFKFLLVVFFFFFSAVIVVFLKLV